MLKINKGKFYGTNYSFAMPEDFNFIVKSDFFCGEKLEFISDDNSIRIELFLLNDSRSAKQDTTEIISDSDFVKIGDFVSVQRGNGKGIGIFYKSRRGEEEHYEERYDFKRNQNGETQFDIDICLWPKASKFAKTIQEAIELPVIKNFLDSIKYN